MIDSLLNIPNIQRKVFTRHFIKNVIIEFSFYALFQDVIIAKKEYLKESFKNLGFTICENISQVQFALGIRDEKPTVNTTDEVVGFVFGNNDEKIRIELVENKLIINVFKYQNFENFFCKIEKIIDVINNVLQDNKLITNISLKKVNSIISTETKSYEDITNVLNSNFLAIMRNDTIPYENFESCYDIFKVRRDEYNCSVSSKCKKRKEDEFEIVLDITISQDLSNSEIKISQVLENINNTNFSIFSWATTDYFKQIMNEENEK
ncbi:TIGR04255 family protein [bacterium]|nr:TIGR04255 family protein [bacterium]